jgi:hypothetical protein
MRTFRILAAGVLAAGVSTASVAQVTEPSVWQGDLFFTSVTTTCTELGVASIGDFDRTIYRPNIAPPPTGQADEALALITSRSAFFLAATGKTLRGKAKANTADIASHATFGGASTTVDLKITPAKIKSDTPVVQISGTINNYFDVKGCNIGVVGALGLRPAD